MRGLRLACFALCAGLVASEETAESSLEQETVVAASTEHPNVILKQINEINDDGTYTVGFEAADGTFKLETRDLEGNVEGKYGYLNDAGEIIIVEYSANNATGFTSDAQQAQGPSPITGAALEPVTQSPEFALEAQRHAAVLAHQARVVEKQQQIAAQRENDIQRQSFANQRGPNRRPVFNAAQFNPNQPAADQFNTQNFNQDFQQFQQQQNTPQQQQQFAPQQQQFAPQQQQQFQQQPQRPAFESQFAQFQAQQQQQQFAPQQQQQQPAFATQQQQQQFAPQQQQFSPQQQQQFAPQQQQFAPQQQQFAPQQPAQRALIPTSQLTLEDIALEGFSRDEDQDGEIDPLPAHLQQQQQFTQQQQFSQQQQFAQQPTAFQPRQQFRQPAPVGPSPAGQQFQGFQTGF